MSTILHGPQRLSYEASDGSRQEFTIKNKDTVRGFVGPDLLHLYDTDGYFLIQRSYRPMDTQPHTIRLHTTHANYLQARVALGDIESRLYGLVQRSWEHRQNDHLI